MGNDVPRTLIFRRGSQEAGGGTQSNAKTAICLPLDRRLVIPVSVVDEVMRSMSTNTPRYPPPPDHPHHIFLPLLFLNPCHFKSPFKHSPAPVQNTNTHAISRLSTKDLDRIVGERGREGGRGRERDGEVGTHKYVCA